MTLSPGTPVGFEDCALLGSFPIEANLALGNLKELPLDAKQKMYSVSQGSITASALVLGLPEDEFDAGYVDLLNRTHAAFPGSVDHAPAFNQPRQLKRRWLHRQIDETMVIIDLLHRATPND